MKTDRWAFKSCELLLTLLIALVVDAYHQLAYSQSITVYTAKPTYDLAVPSGSVVTLEDFSSVATNYSMSTAGDSFDGFTATRIGTGSFGNSGFCPLLNSAPITPTYCPDYNATSPALPGLVGSYSATASVTIVPDNEIYAFGFDVVDWNDGSTRSFFTLYLSNGTNIAVFDTPLDPNAGFRGYILDSASINAGIHIDRIEWTATPGNSELVGYWDITTAAPSKDFSDGPIAGYGGAGHGIVAGLSLGIAVTAETTDYNDPLADADVDDGVALPSLVQGNVVAIPVVVNGTGGFLQAWIDWNGDNSFGAAGEQISSNVQDGGAGDSDGIVNGRIVLSLTVPATAVTTPTFARFRWSTISGVGSTGFASTGEVEDYLLTISAAAPSLTLTKVASATGFTTGDVQNAPAGTVVTYTYTITNTGNQIIDNVALTDSHWGNGTFIGPNIETASLVDLDVSGDSTNSNTANSAWDVLAPTDALVVVVSYTIVQADIDELQ